MTILKKLNLSLILIHLLATFFIILGARQFAFLTDTDLMTFLQHNNINTSKDISSFGQRISTLANWNIAFQLFAICFSFFISLIISLDKKIFWLNSFLVLLTSFLANRFGLLNLTAIKSVAYFPGDQFVDFGSQSALIVNGVLLTIVGMLILFISWTNKFIMKKYIKQTVK